jgi:mannose-6-phosphate isomerase-like protein (cupin superfamily)
MTRASSHRISWSPDARIWKGEFEGARYGSETTIIFTLLKPHQKGPELHRHPYSETFVVRRGRVKFILGRGSLVAKAGDIVVVPAGSPHRFDNDGAEELEMMDIHASGIFQTTWLDSITQQPVNRPAKQ